MIAQAARWPVLAAALAALCLPQAALATGVDGNGEAGKPVGGIASSPDGGSPEAVINSWYRMVLELVRHTATYSPPVASRTFGLLGVASHEAAAGLHPEMKPLAGQLNRLAPAPLPAPGLDEAAVLHGTLGRMVAQLFDNTGPTGQRVMKAVEKRLTARLAEGKDAALVAQSVAHGQAVADHVLAWASDDGGAVISNLGFPETYRLGDSPANWKPTSLIPLQQVPLLPDWGKNRPFAMPEGTSCPLPPPPAYSEEPGTAFFIEAMEVMEIKAALTDEQRLIARFWSDDPMLSPTPPGHWISIALDIMAGQGADAPRKAEVLALLGITLADSFIANWHVKYQYDLLRPVTYIRRVKDKAWEPILITPPFPEYPSGHSTQSGAAAAVLANLFGDPFAFEDATHVRDKMPVRRFASFAEAAREAAESRLYGGIHFRAAVEKGLEQGACVAGFTNALVTRQ
jgi:membrane-associated phospholipid phosphatase